MEFGQKKEFHRISNSTRHTLTTTVYILFGHNNPPYIFVALIYT